MILIGNISDNSFFKGNGMPEVCPIRSYPRCSYVPLVTMMLLIKWKRLVLNQSHRN